jgi:PST family polysaccharide transporter
LSAAVINVFTPIANSTYPYLSRIYQENKKDFLLRFNKINRYYFLCLILVAPIVFLQAEFIIEVFTGSDNVTSVIIFRIFCVFILIAPFARTYSNGLFIMRHERFISIATFFTFLLILSSSIPLVYFYDAIGGSISYVVAQFINISMTMIYFHRASKNLV